MTERIDPKPGEIILDPACGTGGFLTCSHSRTCATNYVKTPDDEELIAAVASRRREEAAAAHAVHDEHAAARHRGSQLRPPRQHARASRTSATPAGSSRHRPHESAVRRQRRSRDRVELPKAVPNARDGRPLPRADHPAAQEGRPRRRRPSRRFALRRGREDTAQGAADGGVQPPHDRAAAELRVQAVREHRHEPALLREGRHRPRTSGSTSTASPRARRRTR